MCKFTFSSLCFLYLAEKQLSKKSLVDCYIKASIPFLSYHVPQIRFLASRAHLLSKKWGGAPVVLAGDYNSTPQVSKLGAFYFFILYLHNAEF